MSAIAFLCAMVSFFFAGAWWDREPRASAYAALFAIFMFAIGWSAP
jgi:hypothetical protein